MKENKEFQIKFRLTATQKAAIEEYAAATGLNISEVMRLAITEFLLARETSKLN